MAEMGNVDVPAPGPAVAAPGAVAPPERACRTAALLHVSALGCGLGLPFVGWGVRRPDGFVAHHARQALAFTLLLLAVAAVHALLHGLTVGVEGFTHQVTASVGAEVPGWQAPVLRTVRAMNVGALVVEVLVLQGLALRMARRARAGQRQAYFFLRGR